AHVAIAIENISIFAAMLIVDEQLWDGQERSTRYQNFKKTKYYIPDGASNTYILIADKMFTQYDILTEKIKLALIEKYEKPTSISEETYIRTLKARAFDVSRYWLPLSTRTSLGQITNARSLEKQISRLFTQSLPEIKEIAQELKDSVVSNEPVNFMFKKINTVNVESKDNLLNNGPLLPTLTKYAKENEYLLKTKKKLKSLVDELFKGYEPTVKYGVKLHIYNNPKNHACSSLIYSVSNFSYEQINSFVENMHDNIKDEIIGTAFQFRGKHDAWLRELQSSPLIFDITMDIGSFRDLNRHRKVSKILQTPSESYGYAIPEIINDLNLFNEYSQEMDSHFHSIKNLSFEWDPLQSQYLLPLGSLCRSLHQMDLHQAAYLIELRTGSAGHFSYREIAYQMFEEIKIKYPELSKYIRAINPREIYDPFKR
ncbi:MAG TPA: FAD-dependent thymidylate synthase, partial [Bacilli bacterium]